MCNITMTPLAKHLLALSLFMMTLTACNAYYDEAYVDEEGFVHECGNEPGLQPCDVNNEAILPQTDQQLEKEAGEEREKINEKEQEIN
jgi:hypothetical protein